MIKCVISDLDGTIVSGEGISAETLAAVKLLQESGVRFIAATGRSRSQIQKFFNSLGFTTDMMLLNGGCYMNRDDGIEFVNGFDEKSLAAVIDCAVGSDAPVVYYGLDEVYSTCDKKSLKYAFERSMKEDGFSGFGDEFYEKVIYCDKKEILRHDIFKVEYMHYDSAQRDTMYERFSAIDDINIARVMRYNIELNPLSCDKGVAARMICDLYGYGPDEVACFGDGENDIPMLELFEHSYAPDTSSQTVQNKSRFICRNCSGNGFHDTIIELIDRR